MAKACLCDTGLANIGSKKCPIATVAKKIIYMQTFADDGTRNEITLADTLDESYWEGKFNAEDPSKRFYISPLLDDVEDVRGDAVTQTLASTANIIVDESTRTFTANMMKHSSILLDNMSAGRCVPISAYTVDTEGKLTGKISVDGLTIRPISINEDTWRPNLVKATATSVQMINLNFEWAITEKDEDLRVVSAEDFEGYSLLDGDSLFDINMAITGISTTGFVGVATLDYGSYKNPNIVKGLLPTDFALFNDTTQLAVVIISATEGPDGTYTFVYAAQTPADVLTLTSAASGGIIVKTGFEVVPTTYTTP